MKLPTAATVLTASLLLTGCTGTTPSGDTGAPVGSATTPMSPAHAAQPDDVAFVRAMIPLHEQALVMAEMALDPRHRASAQIRGLAAEVEATHDPQATTMNTWRAAWDDTDVETVEPTAPTAVPDEATSATPQDTAPAEPGGAGAAPGRRPTTVIEHTTTLEPAPGDPSGSAFMNPQIMEQLGAASGEEFGRLWLELMIAHHERSVATAKQALSSTSKPEVEEMAEQIAQGQSARITRMRELLAAGPASTPT